LNTNLIEDSRLSLKDIQDKVALFMLQFDAIASAITSTQMVQSNFTDGVFKKMQNSFNQKQSGDVMINLKPGYIEDVKYATYSNSPYTYDSHIPLIWYGWKINRRTIYRDINITDIAPTISSLLNISFPNGYTGKPIFELLENK
jgi:bisphosphoglycerate-independent phosphoglycerate mutase (AlkP superfamily)